MVLGAMSAILGNRLYRLNTVNSYVDLTEFDD